MYLLRRGRQEHDELVFNREFPIFSFYHLISLCSVALQEPIPDQRYVMELYAAYTRARKTGDKAKIVQTVTLLKKEELKAEELYKRMQEKYKRVIIEETVRKGAWTTRTVAVLSHEDSE